MRKEIEELAVHPDFESEFHVPTGFWEQLDNLLDVLEIPYIATKSMQRIGYSLADFYITWLRMERGLSRFVSGPTSLAQLLINAMKSREHQLILTPTMMAAMFLDPRIKYKLSNTQKECAVLTLEKLQHRLETVRNVQNENGTNISRNDTLDELNAEAMAECEAHDNRSVDIAVHTVDLRASITKYDSVQRINMKHELMEFWKTHKNDFPILYDLACIVHSVPAGQCLVEQNFSSFQYVCSSRRLRLLPKNISDILMIRLNSKVYDQWRQDRIQEIRG